jgi:hypothetical protein
MILIEVAEDCYGLGKKVYERKKKYQGEEGKRLARQGFGSVNCVEKDNSDISI